MGSLSACIFRSCSCNRGVLYGPWLPIYGFGGVLILFLLRRFAKKAASCFSDDNADCRNDRICDRNNPLGSLSDALVGLSGFPDSSKRVCLSEGSPPLWHGWLLILYLAAPKLNRWYQKLPGGFKTVLCVSLVCFFLTDVILSLIHPNTGFGVTIPRLS